MSDPKAAIFISYRRSSGGVWALAVFQELVAAGHDCFYDIRSIDQGNFDSIILNQIAARPYFMPILTAGTLDRCVNADDWVRIELEHALKLGRKIVPLHTSEFDFGDIDKYLPSALARDFKRLQMNEIPLKFFTLVMRDIRERVLKPIDIPVTPTPQGDQSAVDQMSSEAKAAPKVSEKQLTASEYFDRAAKRPEGRSLDGTIADLTEILRLNPTDIFAYIGRGCTRMTNSRWNKAIGNIEKAKSNIEEAIDDFTEALHLDPTDFRVYCYRGDMRAEKGDLTGAIADYNEAIRLNPKCAEAYTYRGNTRRAKGDLDGAIADYTKSIELENPPPYWTYANRGIVRMAKGDVEGAIADFTKSIELKEPSFGSIQLNRGAARQAKGDLDGAIADYNEALRLNPKFAEVYKNRGIVRGKKGDRQGAAADYQKSLEINPNDGDAQAMRNYIAQHGKK